MIAGLDSSVVAPSAAQALAAKAAGVPLWSGYIATRSGVGLLATWTQAAFDNARLCGAMPLAFCSGWDDPLALRDMAAAWNVRLCVDVENGIRNDGAWVQGWLDAAGAGLYGLASVHPGRNALFHVVARYPGFDPAGVWPSNLPRPEGPLGWQWWGTHNEFGVDVDRGWYDDWFNSAIPSGPGRGGGATGGITMGAGNSITIDGSTIVAVLAKDGNIALASSTGGLGGLESGTYLQLNMFTSDTRDVWLGQDTDSAGTKRLLVFATDGEGSVYGCSVSLSTFAQLTPWANIAGLVRFARVPRYEGEGAEATTPPAAGLTEAQVRAFAADEIAKRLQNG